jgi:Tfp pilus assembly protein PilX
MSVSTAVTPIRRMKMKTANKRGAALMLVVIASIFLIILTAAAYRYFMTNVDTQIWARDRIQAKLSAEAGLNLATHMLVAGASLPTSGTPPLQALLGSESTPAVLPGELGSVYVTVQPSKANSKVITANAFMLHCIAWPPGSTVDTYGMQCIVMPENLARFAVFMNNPSIAGAYVDGYRFDGPFYANGPVRVISDSPTHENDPFFYSFNLTSDYYLSTWGNTQATGPISGNLQMRPLERLQMGAPYFELGIDSIPFGSADLDWQGVRNAALSGGLVLGPGTIQNGSRLRLSGDTLYVKLNMVTPPVAYYLGDLENPVVWIENGNNDRVYLRGVPNKGLNMALTIGMFGHLYMSGTLEYANRDPEDPDNEILLGLMTIHGDIVMANDPLTMEPGWDGFQIVTDDDFAYDAVLVALDGELVAENANWPKLGPKEFLLMGGYMIDAEGWTSTSTTGFDITVFFDPRLLSMHPPFFPTTANWRTIMWRDVPNLLVTDVTNGDMEY